MNLPDISPLPPTLPGNLTCSQLIGHGGAGEVWLVKNNDEQYFAAKIINPRWQNLELNAVCSLKEMPPHPALTQIYQSGELENGNFFYTMELADNISPHEGHYQPDTLAYRIASKNMDCKEILAIIKSVAEGIKHLHLHNKFHGDIKPENIIFVNGKAKIADFGTISGKIHGGTAGFVPDNPVSPCNRDCYALGKTLYCLWSKLDAAEFPSLPEKFSHNEARIIRPLYLRACSSKPTKRFASVTHFIKALDDAQHNHIKQKLIIAGILTAVIFAGWTALRFIPQEKIATNNRSRAEVLSSDARPLQPTPQPAGKFQPDSAEVSLIRQCYMNCKNFSGDFINIKFRKAFEKACREIPDKLPAQEVEWTKNFYRDTDKLLQIYALMDKQIVDDEKFLHTARQHNFTALYQLTKKRSYRTVSNDPGFEKFITAVIKNSTSEVK